MKKILHLSYLILIIFLILFYSLVKMKKNLKIGLLAPLSGEYKELGNSLLYSLQLALSEIGDKNVFIIPRDTGFNDKEKLNLAIKDLSSQNVKIIIGPLNYEDFEKLKKYSDITFYLSIKYEPRIKK